MTDSRRAKNVAGVFAVFAVVAVLTYLLPATVGVFAELSWSHYNPANWHNGSRQILGILIAAELAVAILASAACWND